MLVEYLKKSDSFQVKISHSVSPFFRLSFFDMKQQLHVRESCRNECAYDFHNLESRRGSANLRACVALHVSIQVCDQARMSKRAWDNTGGTRTHSHTHTSSRSTSHWHAPHCPPFNTNYHRTPDVNSLCLPCAPNLATMSTGQRGRSFIVSRWFYMKIVQLFTNDTI